jgi:hypothetical protein
MVEQLRGLILWTVVYVTLGPKGLIKKKWQDMLLKVCNIALKLQSFNIEAQKYLISSTGRIYFLSDMDCCRLFECHYFD